MWVLYLVLFSPLMNILTIILSFGPIPAPGVTPGVNPRGGLGRDFLNQLNPGMWVLYLVLLSLLMNILTICLTFGPTPVPGVTPGGQPQG